MFTDFSHTWRIRECKERLHVDLTKQKKLKEDIGRVAAMLSRISYSAAVLGSLSTVAERAQCFAELKKRSQQRKHLGVYFQDIPKGMPEAKSIKSTMSLTNFKILTSPGLKDSCHKKEQSFLNGRGWVFFLLF